MSDCCWNVPFTASIGNGSSTIDVVQNTRVIVPQSVLGIICHGIVLTLLEPYIFKYSAEQGLDGLVLGLGKGGQIQYIFYTISQVLEIGRDRKDMAAVAVGDVKSHHDTIRFSSLA